MASAAENGPCERELTKDEVIRLRQKYIGSANEMFFADKPLMIVKGKGTYLYDEEDNRYLDCINNVCHVGHCNPAVVEAMGKQAAVLNTNSRYVHSTIVQLASRLASTFPGRLSKCYFVNSGSEANDLAMRMARAHTGNEAFIILDHAYHGHVTSCIQVSPYKSKKLGPASQSHLVYEAPCPDTYRGKYSSLSHPDLTKEELGRLYTADVKKIIEKMRVDGQKPAAFIAESLQSCGGQIIPPPGYLREVYSLVRAAGGICIADEVQTGFGRVGTHWWAFQTQGDDVVPDIVTIGKPMGNGHPVAAVICTPEVDASFAKSGVCYFNTFGGNPVSMAVAMAVMSEIENKKLMDNCVKTGRYLAKKLEYLKQEHKVIGDVRAIGLFAGIELVKDRDTREPATELAKQLLNHMIQERVLLSADGPDRNVIKIKPPIVFNEDNVNEVVGKLDIALTELESSEGGQ